MTGLALRNEGVRCGGWKEARCTVIGRTIRGFLSSSSLYERCKDDRYVSCGCGGDEGSYKEGVTGMN